MPRSRDRVPVLYLAPWVDVGGSDKGTIDWFRVLDRHRFAPSLITTQPSFNRRLREVIPYAEEVWDLPDLMPGDAAAAFIVAFIHSRQIELLHIMNSRLAFDLLPTIARLPRPPRVVVQLHVEEPDRSGYVRYVTTRYGNIVDAFSVSSQALSDRLDAYHVPVAKRRLIYTGVDAEQEFSPTRVRARPELRTSEKLEILFPARLTPQKNPLLMLDIASRLKANGLAFRVHVLGTGELEGSMRDRFKTHDLAQEVILHGDCFDMAPWYAGSDVVLLTSEFEGLPYVAYEAMAMGSALVMPDLPGVGELVTGGTGMLVSARDLDGYVQAIEALAADPGRRASMGEAARYRASEFPLELMGSEHASLYEELIGDREPPSCPQTVPVSSPAFRNRRSRKNDLVSVIVPCFNQGHYLDSCLASIDRQTYSPIETIVVDDGSTYSDTLEVLARIEEGGDKRVVRLPVNAGPSAARNAAIDVANGRFVLPVDADDVLVPRAVAALVGQLRRAGERVGFIYPNLQYFGNLSHYFEAPSYNLDALMRSNYCDTCSLIDREVFDRGLRFAEDALTIHEDWDFFLALAEHGIQGEPAVAKTVLHRKHGFTRSDSLTRASTAERIAARHPMLFDARTRGQLKGAWSPAVSIIALDPTPTDTARTLRELTVAATRQTCSDFELLVVTSDEPPASPLGSRLRHLPAALIDSRAHALSLGVQAARGSTLLALYGEVEAVLCDPTVIEKGLRALQSGDGIRALAFADSGDELPPLQLLTPSRAKNARLWGLWWEATGSAAPSATIELPASRPLERLAIWLSFIGVQWRETVGRGGHAAEARRAASTRLGSPPHRRKRDAVIRLESRAHLPDLPPQVSEPAGEHRRWVPPQSRLLCRHIDQRSGRYQFSNDPVAPPGLALDLIIGCVRDLSFTGTESLMLDAELGFRLGVNVGHDARELLGFIEQVHLPLLDPLLMGRHRATGQPVLASGDGDPLVAQLEQPVQIGYVEGYPVKPRQPPRHDVAHGLVGLVRTVDRAARRHRYGAGHVPNGELAGELGALLIERSNDVEPLLIGSDGRLQIDRKLVDRPSLQTAVRWAAAPVSWSGNAVPRLRAVARRALDCGLQLAPSRAPACAPSPAGYVLQSPTAWTVPLYQSDHPVLDDQLLSTSEAEPRQFGYVNVRLLGYLVARPLVTDRLGIIRGGVPWAKNFGLTA
jgi:glycosyltransferase involved in cell wall biosynthesis/GT2 family glycosyltransferase